MCTKPGLNKNTCFGYFVFLSCAKRVSAELTFSHKSLGFAGSLFACFDQNLNFGIFNKPPNFDFLTNFGHLLGLPEQLWHTQLWPNFGLFGPTLVALPNHMWRTRRVFGV
jgi:hypothetical protein